MLYYITVNKKNAEIMSTYVNKTGEKEYQDYQVINIMDIKEKKLEIEIEIELNKMQLNEGIVIPIDEKNSIPINKKIELDIERQNTQAQNLKK